VNYLTLLDGSLIYFTERGRITVDLGNVALNQKGHLVTKVTEIALQKQHRASAVSESRAAPHLTAQWYTDPEGALLIRWVIEAEQDERRLPDALAA
jgi:hypothetical protein